MAPPNIAIIIYTLYHHIATMAEAEKRGIEAAGGSATIYQIAETLPQEVLTKMHAPPKPNYPILSPNEIGQFDGFIIGVPTRYGFLYQDMADTILLLQAFWDATGGLWQAGKLHGKYGGVFVSTGGHGGGQEATVIACLSTFAHHGISYVPLGYARAFPQITNLSEAHGGSPWGAGTFAAADGSRQPSALELEIAEIQGNTFYTQVARSFR
ncbi:1,4-benzoquinone reductase [Lactifluus subvellereus]|nr:1,4-benzoquinone reductase [Lactifluus subvellereus]